MEPERGIHADRVEKIFSQFAHQIRLPCSSREVHKELNATWLKPEMINGIYILTGWIPVNPGDDGTAFYIDLRSNADDLTGGIYVALSGDEGSWNEMTEQQALEFFTGMAPTGIRVLQNKRLRVWLERD